MMRPRNVKIYIKNGDFKNRVCILCEIFGHMSSERKIISSSEQHNDTYVMM